MQYLKRLLALMLVFFGWKSLQARPLPSNPPQSTPATANQSGTAKTNPPTTNLVISPAKGPAISTEQEQKARALLEQATGAAIAADSQAKPGAVENKIATTPTDPAATALERKVKEDTDRDKEIARIEAA